uniref:MYND-type domain-containing protein n=1 Tax=Tetradesmus obliquus TaxID=3088 RepID=A0A383VJQ5_TETOB|eukprot:jgi/Sobl393_1/15939/SZX65069.1
MQYREVAWAQQLYFQRLLHGPAAEVTERSYPNYPATAMREIIRQSEHPHNVEPLLLTLRRPQNSATRKRFAEAAGELVLIEKVLNASPLATDFKMAVHGRIVDAADGILYPTQSCNTKYETWLRTEMLDVLRMMLEEGLVKSLVPEMQAKLIADLLQLSCKPPQSSKSSSNGASLQESSSSSVEQQEEEDAADTEQDSSNGDSAGSNEQQDDELVRLYAFSAAYAAFKRFPAARAVAMRAGFLQAAAAHLAAVLEQGSSSSGSSSEAGSVLATDPFERLKAITTAVEAIYFVSLCNTQGEYTLAGAGAGSGAAAATAAADASNGAVSTNGVPSLDQLQRQQHLAPLVEVGVAPLLVRAVQQAWQELQARSAFTYTPPAKKPAAKEAEGDAEQGKEEESEEQQELRAKAEEAVAAANMTFGENWQLFLKTVYDTELVPGYARAALQLGCGLLQLLAHEGVKGQLPPRELLQQLASYSQDPLLSTTGRILLAGTAADADARAAAGSDASTAIVALPQHQQLELAEFSRLCHACNKPEDAAVKLLKCSACGCVSYCCSGCQKADWKAGHKQVCKDLAASRAKLVAA